MFKKGDVVRCKAGEGFLPFIVEGQDYVVKGENEDEDLVLLEGVEEGWFPSRFELVQDGTPVERKFKIGDKVYVTGEDKYTNHRCMSHFINDGEAYIIQQKHDELPDFFLLSNAWWYKPSSITHIDDIGKVVKKPKKVVKAPKPPKPKRIKKFPRKSPRAVLVADTLARNKGGICAMAWQYENNQIEIDRDMPCHARLAYKGKGHTIKALVYGLIHEQRIKFQDKKKQSFKDYKRVVDYTIRQSPWSECFLTHDVNIALRYDILMDVSKPRNWIAGACIALRQTSERIYNNKLFCQLVDKGHNPHSAYLLSRSYYVNDKGDISYGGMGGGHMALYDGMVFDELIAFFKDGYTKGVDAPPFSTHHDSYRVFVDIAASDYDARRFIAPEKTIGHWMRNSVKCKVKGEGWQKTTVYTIENLSDAAAILDKLFIKEVKA